MAKYGAPYGCVRATDTPERVDEDEIEYDRREDALLDVASGDAGVEPEDVALQRRDDTLRVSSCMRIVLFRYETRELRRRWRPSIDAVAGIDVSSGVICSGVLGAADEAVCH